jgi:hypothetical protein
MKGLRKISVAGGQYLYRVQHRHGANCVETFTAYLEGKKRAPLRILFVADSTRNAGYPETGVVWMHAAPADDRNLNTPSVAAELIRLGHAAGWSPESQPRSFVIEDGFTLFWK